MSRILSANGVAIAEAAQILRSGGLVAFPTETVYGLGADALNPQAVASIFHAKQRPRTSPLIVHVADSQQARQFSRSWPDQAELLASAFWPGPLTLVLPKAAVIPDAITGGLDAVGLRVPAHPVARALIEASGVPIAAPSANRFTQISPTCAAHVLAGLGDAVAVILDGGPSAFGIESTVVRIEPDGVRMLRPGALPRRLIESVLGAALLDSPTRGPDPHKSADAAPGMHERHYAPRTPTFLLYEGQTLPPGLGVILARTLQRPDADSIAVRRLPDSPLGYAAELYARLHEADAGGFAWIAIEALPASEDWEALNDRIARATHPA